MASQPSILKSKFTYFEHKDVLTELKQMAKEESDKRGRTVTLPELIREVALKRANERRKKMGKKLLDLDPSAGKFASAGPGAVSQVIIRTGGKIEAYNKKGDRLPEWKKLEQLEEITRLFRRVKVGHEVAMPQQRKTA